MWIRRSGESRGLSQRVDSGFRRNDGEIGMTGKIGMAVWIRRSGENRGLSQRVDSGFRRNDGRNWNDGENWDDGEN